jgi:hypothetical protein
MAAIVEVIHLWDTLKAITGDLDRRFFFFLETHRWRNLLRSFELGNDPLCTRCQGQLGSLEALCWPNFDGEGRVHERAVWRLGSDDIFGWTAAWVVQDHKRTSRSHAESGELSMTTWRTATAGRLFQKIPPPALKDDVDIGESVFGELSFTVMS